MKLILTTLASISPEHPSTGTTPQVLAHSVKPMMTNGGLTDFKTVYEIGTRVAEYANRTKLAKLDSSTGKGLLYLWTCDKRPLNLTENSVNSAMRDISSAVDLLSDILRHSLVQSATKIQDYSCTLQVGKVRLLVEVQDANTPVEQIPEEPDNRTRSVKDFKSEIDNYLSKNIEFGFKEEA